MKFEDISEYALPLLSFYINSWELTQHSREAKEVLRKHTDVDDTEIQFLVEYYSLVREGKTNYVATTAFRDVTMGEEPQKPHEFFKIYEEEFAPNKKAAKKRKVDGK